MYNGPEDSWFQTLEFPEKTARLVLAEKQKKYLCQLKETSNGYFVVLYRGYTKVEKSEIKKAEKSAG